MTSRSAPPLRQTLTAVAVNRARHEGFDCYGRQNRYIAKDSDFPQVRSNCDAPRRWTAAHAGRDVFFRFDHVRPGVRPLPGVGPVNRSMGGAGTAAATGCDGRSELEPGFHQRVVAIPGRHRGRRHLQPQPGEFGSRDRHSWGKSRARPTATWACGRCPPSASFTSRMILDSRMDWAFRRSAGSSRIMRPARRILLFMPPPTGFGHMYSRLGIVQFSPTVSPTRSRTGCRSVSRRRSTWRMCNRPPFPFQGPNPPGVYPPATGNRNIWGLGAQAGLYYESDTGVNLGASIKSPQWFERAEFNSVDEFGFGREVSTQFEYPMIISLGAAYDGLDNVVIAADVRYIDFDSTELFGEPAQFQPASGAVRGLGWESVWMFIIGGQVELTDRLSFRMGLLIQSKSDSGSRGDVQCSGAGHVSKRDQHRHLVPVDARHRRASDVRACLRQYDRRSARCAARRPGSTGDPVARTRAAISQEIDALVFGVSVLF